MISETAMLGLSAAAIAFAHTVLGPDHYLPFVAMAKARRWSTAKTLRITLACGLGHLFGSMALGLLGIMLGIQLSALTWLEGFRGSLAAWLLVGFGLAYTAWGLRQAWRDRPHTHWHRHGDLVHAHEHSHRDVHAHLHARAGDGPSGRLAPWIVFVIFVLGPCEPLIPLLMYPAARASLAGVFVVTAVFGLVTVMTMTGVVAITLSGLQRLRWRRLEPYGQALAGCAILVCGLAVVFMGL